MDTDITRSPVGRGTDRARPHMRSVITARLLPVSGRAAQRGEIEAEWCIRTLRVVCKHTRFASLLRSGRASIEQTYELVLVSANSALSGKTVPSSSTGGPILKTCKIEAKLMNNAISTKWRPGHILMIISAIGSWKTYVKVPSSEAKRERCRVAHIRINLPILQKALGTEVVGVWVLRLVPGHRPISK